MMKYGHLLNQRRINSGYSLRLIEIRKKSLEYISEDATMSVLKDYGNSCRHYTVNVLFFIQISGLHTMKFCQQKDTMRKVKSFYSSPADIKAVYYFVYCTTGVVLRCSSEMGIFSNC